MTSSGPFQPEPCYDSLTKPIFIFRIILLRRKICFTGDTTAGLEQGSTSSQSPESEQRPHTVSPSALIIRLTL